MNNYLARGLLFLLTFFAAQAIGSPLTVHLGPATPMVSTSLGLYGDQSVTSIIIICQVSATTFTWNIGSGWQTSSGATGMVQTTGGTLTVVPVAGWMGCDPVVISVSGTTTTGGGKPPATQRFVKNGGDGDITTQGTGFTYTASFSQQNPFELLTPIEIADPDPGQLITASLSGVASGVQYTWSIVSGSFWSFAPNTVPNANAMVVMDENPATTIPYVNNLATGTIAVSINVPGSSHCATNLSASVTFLHEEGDPGLPAGTGTGHCFTTDEQGDLVEIECQVWNDQRRRAIYPNPAGNEFNVNFNKPIHSVLSLFDPAGKLIGTKESTTDQIKWDTSSLPAGIYILKINDGTKTTTEHLLIKN